ncbi:MAG: hypothetical protein O9302_00345 [Cyclobacteriaceae bacterium]|jgi:hypothetical protein|nr:hypothetical protein [Cytophagales bacterium]MCZ8326480.1 hypothetical protein [Cyclobacteriaceae bacterium]
MSLITTIEEIAKYVAIDENSSINNFQPYINEAEELYLKELLGDSFLQDLQTVYTTANGIIDDMPAAYKVLFPKIQRALSYYTLVLAIPHITLSIGNMGLRETAGFESSNVAPRWKEEKLQLHCIYQGDLHAEKMLEHLEKNASVSTFSAWFNSDYNTINSGTLVYNTSIASSYIAINKSRRVYLKLKQTIQQLEKRYVPKLIGKEQYDELVIQLRTGGINNNPTTANKALIKMLEPIISKRALYEQIPFLQLSIQGDGIWLYSDVKEIQKKDYLATEAQTKNMRTQLMQGQLGFLTDEDELKQFLLDNIDNYPLVKASGVYTSRPIPGPTWTTPEPDPGSKYLAI